jgi:DNA polymerase I-like protein with 3'-5' exonuclease and polymerase domains
LLLPTNPDYQIVEIDYSQLEMRIGAWVAETLIGQGQDLTLTNLILDGVDMHAYTRDNAGIPEILLNGRSVSKYMETERGHDLSQYESDDDLNDAFMKYARFVAKVPNFAAMYGGGWQALTNILDGITETQARQIMEGWRLSYPTIIRAMTALTGEAMKWRYPPGSQITLNRGKPSYPVKYQYIQYPDLCTPFIRKWNYYSEYEKKEKSKDAFNSMVQGTAGFITIESIARVFDWFPGNELTPHLTVHDSFIFSIDPENKSILPHIADIMTDWEIYPPLEVDVEVAPVGGSWGEKSSI